jgi:hypothetical protein
MVDRLHDVLPKSEERFKNVTLFSSAYIRDSSEHVSFDTLKHIKKEAEKEKTEKGVDRLLRDILFTANSRFCSGKCTFEANFAK